MTVQSHPHGDTLILEVGTARLDALNAIEAQSALVQQIGPGVKRVVLDLGTVSYLSSAGLRTLMQVTKHTVAAGGRLALCRVQDPVREIVAIAGLEGMLPLLAGHTEALGEW